MDANHAEAIIEVLSKLAFRDALFEVSVVAARTRTSTCWGRLSPTGMISCCSRNRKSFRLHVAAEDRRFHPGTAFRLPRTARGPGWSATAPVKLPRRCPKSWLSAVSRPVVVQLARQKRRAAAMRTDVDRSRDELLAGSAFARRSGRSNRCPEGGEFVRPRATSLRSRRESPARVVPASDRLAHPEARSSGRAPHTGRNLVEPPWQSSASAEPRSRSNGCEDFNGGEPRTVDTLTERLESEASWYRGLLVPGKAPPVCVRFDIASDRSDGFACRHWAVE